MGRQKGHELAAEMGFYRGCCMAWLALLRDNDGVTSALRPELTKASDKLMASMQAVADMAMATPRENTMDEDLVARVASCRAKFKTVTALLRADVKFDRAADAAARDMTF
eukprot:TRINITY_DN3562_c0_g1_i1.p3 TRINITY_DN3562_c0_g1~~TRINITY_DN3562_c0_g1_i1.p3  ORF type:complete len:119 (-),score=43.03 TRINITY_DN3562_c0_g1_i1:806-1135(-)